MKIGINTRIWQYAICAAFAFTGLYPVLLMFLSSLKSNIDIFNNPVSLPKSFELESYRKLFEQLPYFKYVYNSIFVTVLSVAIMLVVGAMASYYISRSRFRWAGLLYFFFLLGMMIPIKLGIVPLFILMKSLGLLDSVWSLVCIYTAIGIPICILILTGFFRTLPAALEEAARIDGCSDIGILWHIIVPLMRPALGTVMIINFIQVWNDFFFPLIFIQEETKKTIPVGMLTLFSEYSADWSVLFAGLALSSLPMILLFMIASRQFMEGLTSGAVK